MTYGWLRRYFNLYIGVTKLKVKEEQANLQKVVLYVRTLWCRVDEIYIKQQKHGY